MRVLVSVDMEWIAGVGDGACAYDAAARVPGRVISELDRKRAEGKRHNADLICLSRRRCDVILDMVRTRQPYRAGRGTAADLLAA